VSDDRAGRADRDDLPDLSDELIARPSSTQQVLEDILDALERIEAKLDGTWREGPNPL
jgi:hypothetical protein